MIRQVFAILAVVLQAVVSDAEPVQLNVATFREQVETHELTYVFFYTKKSQDWEEALAVFQNATELLQAQLPKVLCGVVDLDDNVPLTLYTKFNSVDVMVFFPDFFATPLRFHGEYSPNGILQSAKRFDLYTASHLRSWGNPATLIEDFVEIKFKGNTERGNLSSVIAAAEFYATKMDIYTEYLQLVKDDIANLVEVSNKLRFELHNSKDLEKVNEEGEFENENNFLHNKLRLAFADDILQHMFPNKKLPKFSQPANAFLKKQEADRKRQIVLDAQARAASADHVEELM